MTHSRRDSRPLSRTVVVIGHGMVGHRFVQSLRERDQAGIWRVVVIAEETHAAYDRVGLSSYVARGTGHRWRCTATTMRVTTRCGYVWGRRSPRSTGTGNG